MHSLARGVPNSSLDKPVWQRQCLDEEVEKKASKNKSVALKKAEIRERTNAPGYLTIPIQEHPPDPSRVILDDSGSIACETTLVVALELSRTTAGHFGHLNIFMHVVHASHTTLTIPAYQFNAKNNYSKRKLTYHQQDHLLLFPGYPLPIKNFPVLTLDPRSPKRWYWHHRKILKSYAGCVHCDKSVVVVSNHTQISLIHMKLGASPDLILDYLARTAGHNDISNFGESFVSLSTHNDADYCLTHTSNDSRIEDASHCYGPWDLKTISTPQASDHLLVTLQDTSSPCSQCAATCNHLQPLAEPLATSAKHALVCFVIPNSWFGAVGDG
jgi:hypothetical protein